MAWFVTASSTAGGGQETAGGEGAARAAVAGVHPHAREGSDGKTAAEPAERAALRALGHQQSWRGADALQTTRPRALHQGLPPGQHFAGSVLITLCR